MLIINMRLCTIKNKEIKYNNFENFFSLENKKIKKYNQFFIR